MYANFNGVAVSLLCWDSSSSPFQATHFLTAGKFHVFILWRHKLKWHRRDTFRYIYVNRYLLSTTVGFKAFWIFIYSIPSTFLLYVHHGHDIFKVEKSFFMLLSQVHRKKVSVQPIADNCRQVQKSHKNFPFAECCSWSQIYEWPWV